MWAYMVLMCKLVKDTNMFVKQCVLTYLFFGNGQGVSLLEHVRLLEQI